MAERAGSSRRRQDARFALGCAAALAAYNNLAGLHPWHRRWYVLLNLGAAGALLAASSASGFGAGEPGLSGEALPRGVRLGTRFAAVVTAGWVLAAAVPAARPLLGDRRLAGQSGGQAACQALVRIPVGTVLWEEAAFRGVLQAAVCRLLPRPAAVAVTSVVFGVWHVRPALEGLGVNGLARGRGATAAGVTGVVAATAAGGAFLSWLRLRSGSLAAPLLLHLATNSPGPLAAWLTRTAFRQRRA